MILKNKSFCAEINKDGVLTSFSLNDDKYSANFILSSIDEPWVPENKQWGLGFITAGHEHKQIETCTCLKCDDNKVTAVYEIEYTEPRFSCVWNGDIEKSRKDRKITVTVTRELKDDGLYEYYEFRNDTDKVMALDEIGIYSSFRDVYVAKPNALHTHVNSHICIAGDLCYIEAQRQSGIGTNIALITLEGAFETYQLEEQNSSNIRGVVALVAKDIRIASGGIKTFSRVLTDYNRRENFEQKLSRYTGYPIVDYGRMIVQKDESIQLTVKDIADLKDIKIEGELLTGDTYIPAETGEIHGRIRYGCKTAKLKYKVITI